MTINEILQQRIINGLDAELILCYVLQKNRTWLIAHAQDVCSPKQIELYNQLSKRRQAGQPIAYITGLREFYGRDFIITPHVLVPRPCTEALVESMLQLLKNPRVVSDSREIDTEISVWRHCWKTPIEDCTIIDVGCGSGVLAGTLAKELPNNPIIALDIDPAAIECTKLNCKQLNVKKQVECRLGDCLEPIQSYNKSFIIISNPPYIPIDGYVTPAVRAYEPHHALFSEHNGTSVLQKICTSARKNPLCVGWIIECRTEQIQTISL